MANNLQPNSTWLSRSCQNCIAALGASVVKESGRFRWTIMLTVINFMRFRVLATAAAITLSRWLSAALATRLLRRCRWARRGGSRRCSLLRLADFDDNRLQFNIWWLILDDRIARLRLGMMHDEWRRLDDNRLRFDIDICWLRSHNDWRLLVDINDFLRSLRWLRRLLWLAMLWGLFDGSRVIWFGAGIVMRIGMGRRMFDWFLQRSFVAVVRSIENLGIFKMILVGNVVLFANGIAVIVWTVATSIFVQMIADTLIRQVVGFAAIVALAMIPVLHHSHPHVPIVIVIFHQQRLVRSWYQILTCSREKWVSKECEEAKLTRSAMADRNMKTFRFFMIEFHTQTRNWWHLHNASHLNMKWKFLENVSRTW